MKKGLVWVMIFGSLAVSFVFLKSRSEETKLDVAKAERCMVPYGNEVWIDGGSFIIGENEAYDEEKPQHEIQLEGFWIDVHEVTNNQFARFVDETGYVTVAEKKPELGTEDDTPYEMTLPGSIVFTPPKLGSNITNWWQYVPGANWKNPYGPGSDIVGKGNLPVVHIAFEDAKAYADWAGRDLPTEAQFEVAARNKLKKSFYSNGTELIADGEYVSNTWQGLFPVHNSLEDGFEGIAPVKCFKANRYGAHDLIGNVWEWTENWYTPKHNPQDKVNPAGPKRSNSYDPRNLGYPVKVIKGGSYLCAQNFCQRYRPAARHAQDTGLGTQHIGFRTVRNL